MAKLLPSGPQVKAWGATSGSKPRDCGLAPLCSLFSFLVDRTYDKPLRDGGETPWKEPGAEPQPPTDEKQTSVYLLRAAELLLRPFVTGAWPYVNQQSITTYHNAWHKGGTQ